MTSGYAIEWRRLLLIFENVLHEKGLQTNKRPYTRQQPKTKSARGLDDQSLTYQPRVNHRVTASQPVVVFLHRFIPGHALHEKGLHR